MASEAAAPETAIETFLTERKIPIPRLLALVIAGLAILIPLFHLYTGFFTQTKPFAQAYLCVYMVLALAFLLYPLGRKSWKDRLNRWFIADAICFVIISACAVYYITVHDEIIMRIGEPTTVDYIVGTITIILALEATRRCVGWPMVAVAVALLAINLTATHLPGFLYGPSVSWTRMVEVLFMATFGVIGIPIRATTGYLIMFFILIAFLTRSGGGRIFLNIAMAAMGRFAGGPAKGAVIGSSLLGTMTGSTVANVAGTGSITIPMMKEYGFKPHLAGAVEATASTGGQIMPPIMGLTAFLIAEFMGLDYFMICLAAIIPVALYYLGVFMSVHFESKKIGLVGIPKSELPSLSSALRAGWPFVFVLIILFVFLARGVGLANAAFWALFTLFVLVMISKTTRMTPKTVLMAFEDAGRLSTTLGTVVITAGIIVGCFWVSGLGEMIAGLVVTASGEQLWIGLIITAVVCLILGMGIPTPAIYVMTFLFAIPALIELGATPLAANFFCFYWGVMSAITPPVCVAAFTGAAIAGAGMMRTGFTAARIGLPAYIIAFLFVFSPQILALGTDPVPALLIGVKGGVGVIALAAGTSGWFLRRENWIEMAVLLMAGVLLMIPGLATDIAGAALMALSLVTQKRFAYREPLKMFARGSDNRTQGKG